MFTKNNVTLRPFAFDDMNSIYSWMSDIELVLYGGFTPIIEDALSPDTFRPLFEQRFVQSSEHGIMFGIAFEQRLVGFIQLARIEPHMRRAAIGICVGEKDLQGKGIATNALSLLLDYAFTVKNLERIYAEVFSFNHRSQKLMERVGFQREGLLRQHDLHNGVRQDTYLYGILKPEFYQKHETIFKLNLPPS